MQQNRGGTGKKEKKEIEHGEAGLEAVAIICHIQWLYSADNHSKLLTVVCKALVDWASVYQSDLSYAFLFATASLSTVPFSPVQ